VGRLKERLLAVGVLSVVHRARSMVLASSR
jgi:hypothetical protein